MATDSKEDRLYAELRRERMARRRANVLERERAIRTADLNRADFIRSLQRENDARHAAAIKAARDIPPERTARPVKPRRLTPLESQRVRHDPRTLTDKGIAKAARERQARKVLQELADDVRAINRAAQLIRKLDQLTPDPLDIAELVVDVLDPLIESRLNPNANLPDVIGPYVRYNTCIGARPPTHVVISNGSSGTPFTVCSSGQASGNPLPLPVNPSQFSVPWARNFAVGRKTSDSPLRFFAGEYYVRPVSYTPDPNLKIGAFSGLPYALNSLESVSPNAARHAPSIPSGVGDPREIYRAQERIAEALSEEPLTHQLVQVHSGNAPPGGTRIGTKQGAPRQPPGRDKEQKSKAGKIAAQIFKRLDQVSEASEIVDAVYDALPKSVKERWGKDRPDRGMVDNAGQYGIDGADWKLQAIYHNFHKVDWNKAAQNILKNEIEDKIIGGIDSKMPGYASSLSSAEPVSEILKHVFGKIGL